MSYAANSARYRETHPSRKKEQNDRYYSKNKEVILQRKRERYRAKRAAQIADGTVIPKIKQTRAERNAKARERYKKKKMLNKKISDSSKQNND